MSQCQRKESTGECLTHPGATFLFGDVCEEVEALEEGQS